LRIPLHLSRSALWKIEKNKKTRQEEKTRTMRNTDNEDLSCERKGTRHSPSEIDGSRFLERKGRNSARDRTTQSMRNKMLTFLSTDTASPSRSATVSSSPSRVRYTTASNPLHSRKTATNTTKNRGSQGSRPIDVIFPSNDGHLNTFYFRTMGEKEKKKGVPRRNKLQRTILFWEGLFKGGMIGSCF